MTSILGKKERIIWILIVIAMVVTTIFVVNKYQTTLNMFNQKALELKAEQTKFNTLNQKFSELKAEQTTWSKKEETLNMKVAKLTDESEECSLIINEISSKDESINFALKRQGFDVNVQDIKKDLMKHNELIPNKGVLGGKMGFYSEKGISVLSDKWVFAEFEDGHIEGNMLLSYSVKNGKISWKVIDSHLLIY